MRNLKLLVAVLAVSVSGIAAAQDGGGVGNVNVFLQGGLSQYTGDFGKNTNAGPAFGLKVNLQPWKALGFEVGYDGSRNGYDLGILETDAALMRHSLSGLVKLSLPLEVFRPFVGVGLAASYVYLQNAGFDSDKFIQEIPFVGGLEIHTGRLIAGARVTYHKLYNADLDNGDSDAQKLGGLIDYTLTLGARF